MDQAKLMLFCLTTLLLPTLVQPYVRGCYFTNWSQYRKGTGRYSPDDYISGLCTHIIYAFFAFGDDFILKATEWNDESTEWSKGQIEKINDLKKSDPNLKTLASVGGWSFERHRFPQMSSTQQGRTTFINSVIAYVRKWGFDGFDIDWEFPAGAEQKANYVLLLKDFHEAFQQESKASGKTQLLLTAAVSAADSTIKSGYDIPQVAKYLDFTFLMSYDFHGAWEAKTDMSSPLYSRPDESSAFKLFNTDSAACIWVENGMPKEKLVIGIPAYGRGWTLANPKMDFGIDARAIGPSAVTTMEPGVAAYYELCIMAQRGATRVWDDQQKAPYLYKGDQWYGYDDVVSIRNKMKFVKSNGYAGAFVWTLDLDDFTGACDVKYPLLNGIQEELAISNPISPSPNPDKPTVSSSHTAFHTEVPDSAVFTCPTDGYFKDPANCEKFYRCVNDETFRFDCPPGTRYSNTAQLCDQEANGIC